MRRTSASASDTAPLPSPGASEPASCFAGPVTSATCPPSCIAAVAGSAATSSVGGGAGIAEGFASIVGMGVEGVTSFACEESLFFSAVFRKARVVMRSLLFGLQSSTETGVCSQTGQVDGRVVLPIIDVSDANVRPTKSASHSFRISSARSKVF